VYLKVLSHVRMLSPVPARRLLRRDRRNNPIQHNQPVETRDVRIFSSPPS
jgi:hypothetical protein